MKYFSYLLLLQTVFWAGCEKSDGENGPAARAFPDPAFRQCVLEYFDFDGDGMVSDDRGGACNGHILSGGGHRLAERNRAVPESEGAQLYPESYFLAGLGRPIARWRLSGVTTIRWSNSM